MGAAVSALFAATAERADAVPGDEPPKRRRLFLIEGVAECDALARLLALRRSAGPADGGPV